MTLLQEEIQQSFQEYQQISLTKAQEAFYRQSFLHDGQFYWPEESYPLEKNRYALIWLPACPRAQRVAATIHLLGLTDWIETIELAPHKDQSWHFPATMDGAYYLYELFEQKAEGIQPCLYDKKRHEVITNDQYNLSKILVRFSNQLEKTPSWKLYPVDKQSQIDAMSGFIFQHVNVQIYRAGHAANVEDKRKEDKKLAQTFQILDRHLGQYSFLFGDTLTDADLRLFPSLLRCPIYAKQFALDSCQLAGYENLRGYVHKIYQIPAIRETTKLEQIVETHYRSPHNLKTFGSKYQKETITSTFGELEII